MRIAAAWLALTEAELPPGPPPQTEAAPLLRGIIYEYFNKL